MFKRIKNLLDISRYTVAEVVNPVSHRTEETDNEYYERTWGYRPATIINPKGTDPFKDFADETPEQPLDDKATRN
jgi:hypothetical protein